MRLALRDRIATEHELGPDAYRAMYEFSPEGVLFTSVDGRVLAANPAACAILGRSEAEIRALGRQGLANPDDNRWRALLDERTRTGRVHGIAGAIRGDGVAVEVEVSAQVFADTDGQIRCCTTIRDVTDRVQIERELIESRARLAEAERVARMGSWEWDPRTDRRKASDGLLRIYGLTSEQFDPTSEGMDKLIYPDDRPLLRETLERALELRSSFRLEHRALRSDGRVRILRIHGDVVVDDRARPIRVVCVVQDVTEARAAQEALQNTSADLERRATELQQIALFGASEPPVVARAALSERQLEILGLIAQGLTNAAIAARLIVTEGTIKWHVKQILAKTGAANRAEAVARVLGEPASRNGHV